MKFNIGERVAIYGGRIDGEVLCCYDGHKGTVKRADSMILTVNMDMDDDSDLQEFHHKQCRKLKIKYKRYFWINFYQNSAPSVHTSESEAELRRTNYFKACILVREASKKK